MRPAVHVDDAETVRPADVENEYALKIAHLDEFEAVRRSDLTRTRRRLAPRVRSVPLEIGLPILVQRAGPGLEGNVVHCQIGGETARPRCDDASRIACQLPPALAYPMSLFTRKRSKIDASIR